MNAFKSFTVTSTVLLFGHANAIGADLQVQVTKQSDWNTGFCSNVSVYNPNSSRELWNISFDAEGLIDNLWNANYVQNQTTLETTAHGVGWNDFVEPDSSISFGYCAKKVVSAPTPPSDGDLIVTESTNAQWDGGFCKNIQVKNSTDHQIDWEITFPINGRVTTSWSSNFSQNSSTLKATASGVDWNNIIQPHGETEFGYCANELAVTPTPTPTVTPIPTVTPTPSPTPTTTVSLFNEFNIGFGGSYAFPFSSTTAGEKIWVSSVDLVVNDDIENNSYYADIKDFDSSAFDNLQDSLKNSKFLVYWLVEGWEESWFNTTKIQEAMNAGYIPVFNYWYFGDKLMNGMPDDAKKAEYATDNQKVVEFLNKLNGTKLLIMEPEFNKENILSSETNQHEFATIIGDAIDSIKSNTSDVLFSLAMTDTGSRSVNSTYAKCEYDNCALGDKYEWGRPEIVYNDLLSRLDFISFQQMIGQFSRDPSNAGGWDSPNPIAYSDDDIGIDELSTRIANFSEFLKNKYNKPVFLPYIAIATATWTDTNSNGVVDSSEVNPNGWEEKANTTYQELSTMKVELQNRGLFGFAPMALFDNPRHDYGGYQYFMNNEYHLGIIKSGAVDGVDTATNGDIVPKSGIIDTLFN
jgi:hypothetical protein